MRSSFSELSKAVGATTAFSKSSRLTGNCSTAFTSKMSCRGLIKPNNYVFVGNLDISFSFKCCFSEILLFALCQKMQTLSNKQKCIQASVV
mgnify:CR=1 FL=1